MCVDLLSQSITHGAGVMCVPMVFAGCELSWTFFVFVTKQPKSDKSSSSDMKPELESVFCC